MIYMHMWVPFGLCNFYLNCSVCFLVVSAAIVKDLPNIPTHGVHSSVPRDLSVIFVLLFAHQA